MQDPIDKPTTLNSFKQLEILKSKPIPLKPKPEKSKGYFEEAKKLLQSLKKAYPIVFNVEKSLPLAVGIEKKIIENHPEFALPVLRLALSIWTRREKYLLAVIEGPQRYHLDGAVASPISESEKAYSQLRLAQKLQKKAAEKKQK